MLVRVLILGGTGEARAVAGELSAAGAEVISSLAGRTPRPARPEGTTRLGGFGGAAGLATYLQAERITAVIDATHPFATRITAAAVGATATAGVPLLILRRPPWEPGPRWQTVADMPAAAAAVRAWPPDAVFLAIGRQHLAAFAADSRHTFVARAISPPSGPLPPRLTMVLARGPFTEDQERALLRDHQIGLLVTRNSGGPMTAAKLHAAAGLGLPVIAVAPPPPPDGTATVATVAEAVRWASPATFGKTPAGR